MFLSSDLNVFFTNCRTMTPRTFPDLIDIEQELFELPHKVFFLPKDLVELYPTLFDSRNAWYTIKKPKLAQ